MINISIKENYPLQSLNTLGLNVKAHHFVEVLTVDELMSAIAYSSQKHLELLILGGGSNLVLKGDYPGLVVKLGIKGVSYKENQVTAFAGENWHELVQDTLNHDLYGLENLSLIPGTTGAAPIQNIGAYGVELASFFERLTAVDIHSGELVTLDKSQCDFGYRDSIFKRKEAGRFVIVSVTLSLQSHFTPQLDYESLRSRVEGMEDELSAQELSKIVCTIRRERLPDTEETGNAGSFFKNPVVRTSQYENLKSNFTEIRTINKSFDEYKLSAAWMIENSGLKGLEIGGAAISSQHSLVIINKGNATPEDIKQLYLNVIDTVKDRFGIVLEIEPVIR